MSEQCPVCHKLFEEIYSVPVNDFEPFTSVDAMKGIQAYSTLMVPKEVVCHAGRFLHFRFVDNGDERLVKMEKFDLETLSERRHYHRDNPHRCEQEGCQADGIPCYMNMSDEEPESWYCDEHAHDAGFCPGCGMFCAGFESFDFSPTGLCAACAEELASEDYDDDFDDEFGFLDPYYDDETEADDELDWHDEDGLDSDDA